MYECPNPCERNGVFEHSSASHSSRAKGEFIWAMCALCSFAGIAAMACVRLRVMSHSCGHRYAARAGCC